MGVLRTLPSKPASWLGFGYVEFFRNMPLLVQMFLWFFVLPELLPHAWGHWLKQMPHAAVLLRAAIGIGLFMSARVAEQVRAGIGSLPRGQKLAAHGARADDGADLPLTCSCRWRSASSCRR